MTDAAHDPAQDPQTQISSPEHGSPAEVSTAGSTPSPDELNAQQHDTSQGQAISAQPVDDAGQGDDAAEAGTDSTGAGRDA